MRPSRRLLSDDSDRRSAVTVTSLMVVPVIVIVPVTLSVRPVAVV